MRLVGVLALLVCLAAFVGCPAQQPTSAEGVRASEGGPEAVPGTVAPPVMEPVPAMPPAAGGTTYVVKPGDTLMAIARKHYGENNGSLWRVIRDANPGKVTGESGIKPGTELVIPPKP